MITLPSALVAEKNKLESAGAWLLLLEITVPQIAETLRMVRNNDDIEWNGETWQAFGFEIDDIDWNSEGKLPEISIRVANPERTVETKVNQADGAYGSTVTLYVVHSEHLDGDEAFSIPFDLVNVECDSEWVTFNLGIERPFMRRFPVHLLSVRCRWPVFKGTQCGFAGSGSTCDRELSTCIAYGNQARFGGFPSLPDQGFYL